MPGTERQRRPGKHSLPRGENPIRNNGADVAELGDARDLKCPATPERSHLFWKTRSRFRHQPAGTKRDLENILGPLMALTVNTLLATMRTVRALQGHLPAYASSSRPRRSNSRASACSQLAATVRSGSTRSS